MAFDASLLFTYWSIFFLAVFLAFIKEYVYRIKTEDQENYQKLVQGLKFNIKKKVKTEAGVRGQVSVKNLSDPCSLSLEEPFLYQSILLKHATQAVFVGG